MSLIVDELKREVVLRPDDPALRFQLAEALFGDGSYALAAKQAQRALGLDPEHQNARRLLARSLERDGRAAEATLALEELVRRHPQDPAAREELMELFLSLGRLDDALLQAEQAATCAPSARRFMAVAELYRMKNLLERARAALESAQRLAPEDAAIGNSLKELYLDLGHDAATGRPPPPPPPPDDREAQPALGRIGVLGWTPKGGAVSPLEAVAVAGRGELIFSGNIGAVGREAGQVAFSCLKSRAAALQIAELITARDLHLHFTDTELGKDGPSSGLALVLAAISAYTQRPLRPLLAATGEITIMGEVKPVGGIHEKMVAACLAGMRTVLLPRRNLREGRELSNEVTARLQLIYVDSVAEAIAHALVAKEGA